MLFGLVEVTIEHLKNGVLCIDLTIVVLLVDLNLLLESFCFGETEPFAPLSQDLHAVEVAKTLLLDHLRLEVLSALSYQILFFFHIAYHYLGGADADHLAAGLQTGDLTFDELAQLNHY